MARACIVGTAMLQNTSHKMPKLLHARLRALAAAAKPPARTPAFINYHLEKVATQLESKKGRE